MTYEVRGMKSLLLHAYFTTPSVNYYHTLPSAVHFYISYLLLRSPTITFVSNLTIAN